MKRIFTLVLAAVLLLAVFPAVTGSRAEAAQTAVPLYGEYKLFTVEYMGKQTDPAALQMDSVLSLNKDGTGKLTMYGMEETISKWTEKDGVLTLYSSEGAPLEATVDKGIVELKTGDTMYLYYARDGVDTKDYVTSGHATGSLLNAYFRTMDADKGAHLVYSFHSDYMDSTSQFDTHVKNGCFICLRTVKAKGISSQLSATLVKDGATYNLYPDEKKGTVVLASTPGAVTVNLLSMDTLYRSVSERAMRTDYTVEEREVDGKTYTVELYPAVDYTVEAAYYFDKDGALVHVLEGPPTALPQLGETFYTVEKIDDKVDESLFDISGYKITEEP